MANNFRISEKLSKCVKVRLLTQKVVACKSSGQRVRGKLEWVAEDGWAGVKTCTGFVEWVNPESVIELDSSTPLNPIS